jgi:hypothetical protein
MRTARLYRTNLVSALRSKAGGRRAEVQNAFARPLGRKEPPRLQLCDENGARTKKPRASMGSTAGQTARARAGGQG